jgi:TonB family protein
MGEENKHINYTAGDIEKYHRGELPAADMHAMEKAALDDPFLADAIEGYGIQQAEFNIQSSEPDINDLKKRLAERVKEKETAPVIKFSWWKVAAIILVVISAGWAYIFMNSKGKEQSVAKNTEVKKEVLLPAVTDSQKTFYNKTDSAASVTNDLAVNEKKQPARNKKFVPEDKATEVAENTPPTASVSQLPGIKNNEQEKNLLKSADDVKKVQADAFAKNDTLRDKPVIARSESNKVFAPAPGRKDKAAATGFISPQYNNGIAATANTFKGNVVDQSNMPVANASIQIPNLNIATITDNKGDFSFKAPDTTLSVSIASAGFETQNLSLRNNSLSNQIILKPDEKGLNEVVVVGYGTKKKETLRRKKDVTISILDAAPSIDWNEYNKYLDENKKIPDDAKDIHGEVVVSFTVDNKNTLKNVRVEKSLHEQLDAEAIRLIKEGPAWKLLKGKKAKASVIVKF